MGQTLAVVTVMLVFANCCGGCSYRMGGGQTASTNASLEDVTGSITLVKQSVERPTDTDLAFARTAASDVLTRGDRNESQPWENPQTGARGSVTPLASAYTSDDGQKCREFLASFVKGESESWMQGEACRTGRGRWEIRAMSPWQRN